MPASSLAILSASAGLQPSGCVGVVARGAGVLRVAHQEAAELGRSGGRAGTGASSASRELAGDAAKRSGVGEGGARDGRTDLPVKWSGRSQPGELRGDGGWGAERGGVLSGRAQSVRDRRSKWQRVGVDAKPVRRRLPQTGVRVSVSAKGRTRGSERAGQHPPGGAWRCVEFEWGVRAAFRGGGCPDCRGGGIGCRVVVSPF